MFLDLPLRVMDIKGKSKQMDLTKLKILCTAKETINKMKRQATEWEQIFANNVTDKGLIPNVYKQVI